MTRGLWVGLIMTGCILTAGCAGSGGKLGPIAAATTDVYRLGPGDELRLSVPGLDSMTNTYRVDDSGSIAVPMLEPIKVAGSSVREVEATIAADIKRRGLVLEPRVSAQILTYRPFYIAGEVQKPGQYPYVPGMSVMTAVSIAGGYTFRANTKAAMITRAANSGLAPPTAPVLPGDQIVVRESWF